MRQVQQHGTAPLQRIFPPYVRSALTLSSTLHKRARRASTGDRHQSTVGTGVGLCPKYCFTHPPPSIPANRPDALREDCRRLLRENVAGQENLQARQVQAGGLDNAVVVLLQGGAEFLFPVLRVGQQRGLLLAHNAELRRLWQPQRRIQAGQGADGESDESGLRGKPFRSPPTLCRHPAGPLPHCTPHPPSTDPINRLSCVGVTAPRPKCSTRCDHDGDESWPSGDISTLMPRLVTSSPTVAWRPWPSRPKLESGLACRE